MCNRSQDNAAARYADIELKRSNFNILPVCFFFTKSRIDGMRGYLQNSSPPSGDPEILGTMKGDRVRVGHPV